MVSVPWFILAELFGVFRPHTILQPQLLLAGTAIIWLIAGPIGLVARAAILQRLVLLGFAAAVLGINGALLLAWRLVFSLATSRRASGSQRVG